MAQVTSLDQYRSRDTAPADEPAKGPQVEDGYTRIANELYEVVNNAQAFPVTLTQLRIVHAIIRRTYGFNKRMDALADTQIAADTGIPRQKVNGAKHALIAMKVLILSEDGRRIGINKAYAEWDFSARPDKKAPVRHPQSDGDSVTKKVTKSVTKTGTHKRKKDIDMKTYVFIADRLAANALVDLSINHFPIHHAKSSAPASRTLPACPHDAILDQWFDTMSEKRQPMRALWKTSQRARDMAARWKQGFMIKHEKTGEPLYSTTEEGIAWWGKFFRFLRKSEFLMRDENNWFGIEWAIRKSNFEKIMELKYHGQGGES